MTLIVGHEGKILFIHSGRSQTDLPEDCVAIRELAREVIHTKAADQRRASPTARTKHSPCRTWWGGTMWITTGKPRRKIFFIFSSREICGFSQAWFFKVQRANGCCTRFFSRFFFFLRFFAEQFRMPPRAANAHQREHDTGPDGGAAAQQPAHKVELEQAPQAPS